MKETIVIRFWESTTKSKRKYPECNWQVYLYQGVRDGQKSKSVITEISMPSGSLLDKGKKSKKQGSCPASNLGIQQSPSSEVSLPVVSLPAANCGPKIVNGIFQK